MADPAQNLPTPEDQQPLAPPAPKALEAVEAAEEKREEVQETLLTPEDAEKAAETITAAGPMVQAEAKKEMSESEKAMSGSAQPLATSPAVLQKKAEEVEVEQAVEGAVAEGPMVQIPAPTVTPEAGAPPPLETSAAYLTQKAEEAVTKKEAEAVTADLVAEREAYEKEDAAKVAAQLELSKEGVSAKMEALTNEKIEAWLAKYEGDLKKGLLDMFHVEPEYEMTDVEVGQFINALTPDTLKKPETLFTGWFDRLQQEGKTLPTVGTDVVGDVLTNVIRKDLSPIAQA